MRARDLENERWDQRRRSLGVRLPERVFIINPPPYSPEPNPGEEMWDIVKGDTCYEVFANVSALRDRMRDISQCSCEDAQSVLRLIGRDWLFVELNATHKNHQSS